MSEKQTVTVYPITNKNVIKLLRLLQAKSEISKKEIRSKTYSCFFSDLKKDLQIVELQMKIYLKQIDIELSEDLRRLISMKREMKGAHHIDKIVKNANHTFEIENDDFATIKIMA